MDFDLSVDQLALREAADALLAKYASRERVRAHVGPGVVVGTNPGAGQPEGPGDTLHAPHGFDAELWKSMAEQGWLAVERNEEQAGLGLGMVEVAVLSEAIGRHLAPAPFLPNVLALDAIEGSSQLDEVAGRLAEGSAVATIAEAHRPGAVAVTAEGGSVFLSGRTDPALYAPSASLALVATAESLFAVDLGATPPAAEPAMDRTRELGILLLDHTPATEIGDAGAVRRLLDRAATALSAELLGIAAASLDMAVEYAKERVQFGKPIGAFQAIKHMLADALVDVEGMRSVCFYAAWCSAEGEPDASLAASMAKAWSSDAARRVTATALQVHGGIGFTWEHDMHLFLKRAQLSSVAFGDAPFHRDRIAAVLRQRVAEGRGVI